MIFKKLSEDVFMFEYDAVSAGVIDEINILNATKLGMNNCIKALSMADVVLIDAVKPSDDERIVPIIKGDATSYNIAAASILAKVTRDRLCLEDAKKYPEYNFEKHYRINTWSSGSVTIKMTNFFSYKFKINNFINFSN